MGGAKADRTQNKRGVRPEKRSQSKFERPLVTGCSIGLKPRPLHVNGRESRQTEKSSCSSNIYLPEKVITI